MAKGFFTALILVIVLPLSKHLGRCNGIKSSNNICKPVLLYYPWTELLQLSAPKAISKLFREKQQHCSIKGKSKTMAEENENKTVILLSH